MFVNSNDHILVCSFQNETADLLYEALDKIPMLSPHLIRVYPRKKIVEVKADTVFMKNSYHKIQEAKEKIKRPTEGDHCTRGEREQI
jgi:hypothetical protein